MSVLTTDLVLYASASVPDEDVSSSGGAIDVLRYLDFTQIAANDTVRAVSDGADTRNLTIEGRNAAGQIVSETKALNGSTAITFSTLATVERVLKAELSAGDASRTVTVARTTGVVTIKALGPNKRGFIAMFRKCAADPSATKDYYVKGFFKNEHATLALTTATVTQSADPSAKITHALDAAKGATTSTANRLTTPGFTFDDTSKAVPTGDLAAGETIGVWFHLTLTAADSAYRSTYTPQIQGNSV